MDKEYEPIPPADVQLYEGIADNARQNVWTSSVSQMGYEPVSYSWNGSNKGKKGKVATLRAVVPSTMSEVVNAKRPKSASHIPTGSREKTIEERMRALNLTSDAFIPVRKPAVRRHVEPAVTQIDNHDPSGTNRPVTASRKKKAEEEQSKPPQKPRRKNVIDGVKYEYDEHGRFVPADEIQRATEEIKARRLKRNAEGEGSRKKSFSKTATGEVKYFNPDCNLITMTREWWEQRRNTIQGEQPKEMWEPNKLPASTLAYQRGDEMLPLTAVKYWPEYMQMEEDDVVITIEYCSGCENHQGACFHDEEMYKKCAEDVKRVMTEFARQYAIRFAVLMKPVKVPFQSPFRKGGRYAITLTKGRSIHNPDISCFQPQPRRDDLVCGVDYSVRLGAMEIQIAVHVGEGKEMVKHILHSKILRGAWPNPLRLVELGENLLRQLGVPKIRPVSLDEFADKFRDAFGMPKSPSLSRSVSKMSFNSTGSSRRARNPPPQLLEFEFDDRIPGRVDKIEHLMHINPRPSTAVTFSGKSAISSVVDSRYEPSTYNRMAANTTAAVALKDDSDHGTHDLSFSSSLNEQPGGVGSSADVAGAGTGGETDTDNGHNMTDAAETAVVHIDAAAGEGGGAVAGAISAPDEKDSSKPAIASTASHSPSTKAEPTAVTPATQEASGKAVVAATAVTGGMDESTAAVSGRAATGTGPLEGTSIVKVVSKASSVGNPSSEGMTPSTKEAVDNTAAAAATATTPATATAPAPATAQIPGDVNKDPIATPGNPSEPDALNLSSSYMEDFEAESGSADSSPGPVPVPAAGPAPGLAQPSTLSDQHSIDILGDVGNTGSASIFELSEEDRNDAKFMDKLNSISAHGPTTTNG